MKNLIIILFIIPIFSFGQEGIYESCPIDPSRYLGAMEAPSSVGNSSSYNFDFGYNASIQLMEGHTYKISTSNSDYDPVLSIYIQNEGNYYKLGFNDDSPYINSVESEIYFTPPINSDQYFIGINEYECYNDFGANATTILSIELIELPTNNITIPVVVHIIHNGESYGVGSNLSDEIIHENIAILNNDFQRLNDDAFLGPEIFSAYSSKVNLTFELAKQDPNGNPTNGIIRHVGKYPTSTDAQFDAETKPYTIWDQNSYLNIWTTDLIFEDGSNNYLGYAQFPESYYNSAPEILGPYVPNTDGVVLDCYIGMGGRTLTHEVGHWVGLLHTFMIPGDCSSDDNCQDTPSQYSENYGCPNIEESINNSCDGYTPTMFSNFMDYSDDNCMNMFTYNQKQIIDYIMQNDRNELLNSNGLNDCFINSSIVQSGDVLTAITEPNDLSGNANWYNIQTQNGVTRYWLMEENSSSFTPKFDCSYFIIVEDENNNCSDTSSIYYFASKASNIGSLITSPNPTNGKVKVKFENNKNQFVTLNLLNNKGIKLDQFLTKNSELEIDLGKYPSGMYYISFDSSNIDEGCIPGEEKQKIINPIILNK